MKKVGIILRNNKSISDKNIYSINEDLIKFLDKYNILVISFTTNKNFNKIKPLLDECDGVVLPGGDIFDDNIYNIIKYLYIKDIPTLGICQGMQEIGIFFNGKLGKLNSKNHQSNKDYVHDIIIKEDGLLSKILNKNKITVNSRHIDYIINTSAKIVAYSKDNIIEAIEIPNKKFFVGVQWHPESLYLDGNSNRLFEYFVNSL